MKLSLQKICYNFFEYLLALTVILNCRSMWQHISGTRTWFNRFLFMLLAVSVFGCVIFKQKLSSVKITKAFLLCIGISAYFGLYIFLSRYMMQINLRNLGAVILLVIYFTLCVENDKIPELFIKYRNIIVVIALVSFILWLAGPIMNIIRPTGYVWYNWTSVIHDKKVPHYFRIFFTTQTANFLGQFRVIRNTAIFTEAPMCSLHFSLSLLISFFLDSKFNKKMIAILIVGIISTVSSTGYIIIVFSIIARFIINENKNNILKIFKIMVAPVMLIAGGYIAYTLIMHKLTGRGSGDIRFDDFSAGFKAWMDKPIMGWGLGNSIGIINHMSGWRMFNTGFSNSIMQILAQGGLYVGGVYVFLWINGLIKKFRSSNKGEIIILGFMFFLFCVTVITYNYIIFVILIYANKNMNYSKNIFQKAGIDIS